MAGPLDDMLRMLLSNDRLPMQPSAGLESYMAGQSPATGRMAQLLQGPGSGARAIQEDPFFMMDAGPSASSGVPSEQLDPSYRGEYPVMDDFGPMDVLGAAEGPMQAGRHPRHAEIAKLLGLKPTVDPQQLGNVLDSLPEEQFKALMEALGYTKPNAP